MFLINLFPPLVVGSCYCSGKTRLQVALHVLWVVLQTGDELFHLLAFVADLVDRCKQREPEEEKFYRLDYKKQEVNGEVEHCNETSKFWGGKNVSPHSLVDHVVLLQDLVDLS